MNIDYFKYNLLYLVPADGWLGGKGGGAGPGLLKRGCVSWPSEEFP